jgi:vacuolar-type H+-ATPase subunit E/Vma4
MAKSFTEVPGSPGPTQTFPVTNPPYNFTENFARNVFEQAAGQEVHLSSNQLVSRVLEELLPQASDQVLDNFIEAFSEVLRVVSMDNYASHVLQKLLDVCAEKVTLLCVRNLSVIIFMI